MPSISSQVDAAMVARPELWQSGPSFSYEDVEQRYPVSTPSPRYTVPIDEAIATNELLGRMKARDVSTQGQLLSQQIAQQKLDYQNNVQKQTEAAIQANVLGRLQPGSDTYEAEKAAIVQQYPLAAQDQGFTSLFHPLDQQHAIQQQSKEVLGRQAFDDDRRAQQNEDQFVRGLQAQLATAGPAALAVYQKNLVPQTPGGIITPDDHIRAYSEAIGEFNKAKAQSLEDKPMTPLQAQNLRREYIGAKERILSRKNNPNHTWGPSDEQDLADIQSDIDSLRGNPSTGAAPVRTAPPQSFFPKPSTKVGP